MDDPVVIKGEVDLGQWIRPAILQIFDIHKMAGSKDSDILIGESYSHGAIAGEYGQFVKEVLAVEKRNRDAVSWKNAENKAGFLMGARANFGTTL